MKKVQLRTDLKCGGCVAIVQPGLDKLENLKNWEVELTSPNKILTIEGSDNITADVQAVFKAAGYSAEKF